MDIVTAGRACLRRWYLFIPILALGALASIHVANATKPTYQSTGQFIVLGSSVVPVPSSATKTPVPRVTVTRGKGSPAPTPTPTAKPTPVPSTMVTNPYQGSPDLLRAAFEAQLNGEVFQSSLATAGFKGSFAVTIQKKEPIFVVTATARHRKMAVDLVTAVLSRSNAELRAVQVASGAPATGLQRTQTITPAATPTDITSGKSKRLVAGIVVTVAAAVALSIALDSLVLVRRRRRTAGVPVTQPLGDPTNTTVLPGDAEVLPGPETDDGEAGGALGRLSHRRNRD